MPFPATDPPQPDEYAAGPGVDHPPASASTPPNVQSPQGTFAQQAEGDQSGSAQARAPTDSHLRSSGTPNAATANTATPAPGALHPSADRAPPAPPGLIDLTGDAFGPPSATAQPFSPPPLFLPPPRPAARAPGRARRLLAGLESPDRMVMSFVQPLAVAVLAPALGALIGMALAAAGDGSSPLGLVALLSGLVVGLLGAVGVLRRVHQHVDEPVRRLRAALERLASGDTGARADLGGPSALRPLLEEFNDVALLTDAQVNFLRRKAEWGDQSRMIFEALELAEDEHDAFLVMEDALALLEPGCRVELLAAARGHTRLRSIAHNPSVPAPGCPVETTAGCVAIRRGQVVTADSSESINSCPQLRDRPGGPSSAICVPVTVAGHPIGVLHAIGPDREAPDPMFADRLTTVAAQVGNRIAALRALETSREEAATDGLTGLSNRRVLEGQLVQLLDSGVPFVMVLADLDSFKLLNDTFGHEAGDRALQLFSRVLQDNIRDHDLVARVGGEEFVVVYPEMSVLRSIEAIERIRQALESAIAKSSGQQFTCSFGVTHSSVGSTVNEILRVADAGLLRAKALGGDQVVYADEAIAAEVFGGSGANLHPSIRLS